ncbi:hypothetical protein GCM10009662_79840 [Catellatospora coxensis]|uniref:Uncharacterized protein n=1 Tax=Catellatospora coxensis TaxID=310354 RepID=A0A8J3KYU7_9ACTN|nr:hypothetical protein Cco03nite_79430 [Catellatospora coxensis]
MIGESGHDQRQPGEVQPDGCGEEEVKAAHAVSVSAAALPRHGTAVSDAATSRIKALFTW